MKRQLLTIIPALLFTIAAQAQKANMIFFAPNEEKFYLVINGIQQNGDPLSNIKITDMAAPMQYSVRIKFVDDKLGIINDKVTVEPDTEKSWSIQQKKKKGTNDTEYLVKVAGEIPIETAGTENTLPPSQVIVYHTEPLPNANADGITFSMNVKDESANVSFNVNAGSSTSSSSSTTTTTTTSTQSGSAGFSGCASPLNQIDFRAQLDRVRSQNTASGRKIIAQKVAQAYCLTARQVYELCDALYMNADKLDLAKYCYQRCYDPQHYEEVYKALPTSSMVRELDEYIARIGLPAMQTTTVVTTPTPHYVPGYNGPYGCPKPMSEASFTSVKSSLVDASFEDTKLSTAKSTVGSNCITTDQVIEICNLFDFENTKLTFAKFAYSKTYDKGNYFKVNKVFDFDTSKEEMNKFVERTR